MNLNSKDFLAFISFGAACACVALYYQSRGWWGLLDGAVFIVINTIAILNFKTKKMHSESSFSAWVELYVSLCIIPILLMTKNVMHSYTPVDWALFLVWFFLILFMLAKRIWQVGKVRSVDDVDICKFPK